MEVTIRLTASLANRFTEKNKVLTQKTVDEGDLFSLLEEIDMRLPGLKRALITESLDIVDSINIYVNGENVRYLGGVNTQIHEGDVVNIIPAAAAG